MKKMLPVAIEWVDSARDMPSWGFENEYRNPKPSSCLSVGFLYKDKKDFKTIVQSVSPGCLLYRLTIPTCSIKKITRLK